MTEIKKFKNLKEAKAFYEKDENYMGKYVHELVEIEGKKVIMCGTDMPYEDIIYDCCSQMIKRLYKQFPELGLELNDLPFEASDLRDKILEYLEEGGIVFEDVDDEY